MPKLYKTFELLGEPFYQKLTPQGFKNAHLALFNDKLNQEYKVFKDLKHAQSILSLSNLAHEYSPIALAYAGHQFGNFVPQLGDGRALLLAEIKKDNTLYDLHLKGSGPTRFSRRGDGLCTLGAALREYIVSEAMHALHVPTTRAVAVVETDEQVAREEIYPGAMICRMAQSHIRVGTFEYFYYRHEFAQLKKLADYTINRLYPEIAQENNPYLSLFQRVANKQLELVAKWQSLGFIHGVMNTDNTNLSGETIDYGPCAFMDHFRHDKVFSSIDRFGRYSYQNQSEIILWNLSAFAQTLIPLVHTDQNESIKLLEKKMDQLKSKQEDIWLNTFSKKFGIETPQNNDKIIINSFLKYLEQNQLDFTNSFYQLKNKIHQDQPEPIYQEIKEYLKKRHIDLSSASKIMQKHNPYLIPRNHQVEKAIELAIQKDYSHAKKLIEAYKEPYHEVDKYYDLTSPPKENEIVHQTFCGT